jgi:hypothetical protein
MVYSDGKKYVGEFRDDEINGKEIFYFKSGNKWDAFFFNNLDY